VAEEAAGGRKWGAVSFQRRRFPRIDITLPVEYTPLGGAGLLPRKIFTENISGGGLLLILTEFFPQSSRLRLRIHLPEVSASSSSLVAIESEVEVVWTEIRTGHERDEYRCGVLFTRIEERDLDRIKEFVKAQMERCP
jgi:c-di-GMP-binding flagellar brake protein YcgR